ncbi:hypothetical protein GCM10025779_18080 [Arthrobacter cryoconiti]
MIQLDNEGDLGRIIPVDVRRAGYRIKTAGIPWMAPYDPLGGIPTTLKGSMDGHGLQSICGT